MKITQIAMVIVGAILMLISPIIAPALYVTTFQTTHQEIPPLYYLGAFILMTTCWASGRTLIRKATPHTTDTPTL
jgi:ABC-type transport system involved in multi-copper enzyme maturation permease subunit